MPAVHDGDGQPLQCVGWPLAFIFCLCAKGNIRVFWAVFSFVHRVQICWRSSVPKRVKSVPEGKGNGGLEGCDLSFICAMVWLTCRGGWPLRSMNRYRRPSVSIIKAYLVSFGLLPFCFGIINAFIKRVYFYNTKGNVFYYKGIFRDHWLLLKKNPVRFKRFGNYSGLFLETGIIWGLL